MNIHRILFIIAIAINSCLAFLQNHPDETTEINRNRMENKTITAAPGLTVDVSLLIRSEEGSLWRRGEEEKINK